MDRYVVVEIRNAVSKQLLANQAISADAGTFQRRNLADRLVIESSADATDCYVVEHEIIDGTPTHILNKYPAAH